MKRRAVLARAVLLAVLAAAGCRDVTFEGGGPLTVTLTADKTSVAAGGAVTFTYDVVGSSLVTFTLDYGDGSSSSLNPAGAQTASGHFTHTFAAPGSYKAVATAEDNAQGTKSAEVTVEVTG